MKRFIINRALQINYVSPFILCLLARRRHLNVCCWYQNNKLFMLNEEKLKILYNKKISSWSITFLLPVRENPASLCITRGCIHMLNQLFSNMPYLKLSSFLFLSFFSLHVHRAMWTTCMKNTVFLDVVYRRQLVFTKRKIDSAQRSSTVVLTFSLVCPFPKKVFGVVWAYITHTSRHLNAPSLCVVCDVKVLRTLAQFLFRRTNIEFEYIII